MAGLGASRARKYLSKGGWIHKLLNCNGLAKFYFRFGGIIEYIKKAAMV